MTNRLYLKHLYERKFYGEYEYQISILTGSCGNYDKLYKN